MEFKKIFLASALLCLAIGFTACNKSQVEKSDDLFESIVSEEATLTLSKAGFTTKSTGLVKANEENYYQAGTMEYLVDGVIEATFNFGQGGQGTLNKGSNSTTKSLKGKSGKSKKYKKVIVSPIVKVTDCKYIVQGTVEYYDLKNNLLATIDFGNGICDEWAVKTFPNNSKPAVTFSQKDWYKK